MVTKLPTALPEILVNLEYYTLHKVNNYIIYLRKMIMFLVYRMSILIHKGRLIKRKKLTMNALLGLLINSDTIFDTFGSLFQLIQDR